VLLGAYGPAQQRWVLSVAKHHERLKTTAHELENRKQVVWRDVMLCDVCHEREARGGTRQTSAFGLFSGIAGFYSRYPL